MSDKIKKDPLLDDESQKEPEKTAKPKAEAKPAEPAEKPAEPAKTPAKAEAGKDIVAETKAILAKSPHVNFIIPLSDGEKSPAYDTVQINGYMLTIQKGTMVNIPVQVANILAEKYRIAMEAGQDKKVDRASDVEDALG